MTSEKRVLIAPKDILSFGFHCPHCGTTYFTPITKLDEIVRHCPNCRQPWATDAQRSVDEHSDAKLLFYFVNFLRDLQRREFGTSVRFEISGDVERKSDDSE